MIPTKEIKKLRAFNKNPKLKKDMVAEVLNHQKLDKIIKGTYQQGSNGDFKGCAVGCSIHSYNVRYKKEIPTNNHKAYETELGIPESLARLEDTLFEGMPDGKALLWPAEFMKAIKVGSDLSLVAPKFISATLRDLLSIREVKDDKEVSKQVLHIAKMWDSVVNGKTPKASAWSAAESAAWSAAWSAAESAAESAAWSAARSAARSAAESAAWAAAWSAARSAARSAAESAAWSAAWSAARSAARSAAESAAWSAAWSAARSAARSAAYYK